MPTFLLITGMPGCGKTTMVKRLVADLRQTASTVKLQGFYTEEARNAQNERIGFDVVTLEGKRGPLAKISSEVTDSNRPASGSSCKVGNYLVYVKEFENLCGNFLESFDEKSFLVIDEIGKMELFSEKFTKFINGLLLSKKNLRIIATVPIKTTLDVIAKLKANPQAEIFHVLKSNRDEIYPHVLQAAKALAK